jgi:hypothetical protein
MTIAVILGGVFVAIILWVYLFKHPTGPEGGG